MSQILAIAIDATCLAQYGRTAAAIEHLDGINPANLLRIHGIHLLTIARDKNGLPLWPEPYASSPHSPQSQRREVAAHLVEARSSHRARHIARGGAPDAVKYQPHLWLPPRSDDDAGKQAAWIKRHIRSTVQDTVLFAALGTDAPDLCAYEIAKLRAYVRRVAHIWGFTPELADAALADESNAAKIRAEALCNNVRRTVWPLIKTRAPGASVIAAAKTAIAGTPIPHDDLVALVATISREAANGAPRRAA